MNAILVSDAETRKAFDVISIVSSSFPATPIIAGDVRGNSHSKRYLRKLFHCRTETLRASDESVFVEDLDLIAEKYSGEEIVVLPMEERTVVFFYAYLQKNGKKNFSFLLPVFEVFNTLRDKGLLNAFCAKAGYSAPYSYSVSELESLPASAYPILLKPCVGSGAEGQFRLSRQEDYTEAVKIAVTGRPYVAQEFIGNGRDVQGAFFLYDENGFVDAYTHERIRTSPPGGGVTVLSKLTHNEELIQEGRRILDNIGWKGLIMLEFMYDSKTGSYKVIEANPRLWGSIMLSEYGGSYLLTNYIRICIGEPIQSNHKEGDCFIRWFFPVDLLNYLKCLGRIKGFWIFRDTCFINWSYAPKASAIRFNLHNLFRLSNLKRFLR